MNGVEHTEIKEGTHNGDQSISSSNITQSDTPGHEQTKPAVSFHNT